MIQPDGKSALLPRAWQTPATGSPVAAYAVIGLFAAGIASSLTCVGVLLQRFGGSLIGRDSRLAHLPWAYIRAGLILAIGVFYTLRLAI